VRARSDEHLLQVWGGAAAERALANQAKTAAKAAELGIKPHTARYPL